MELTLDTFTDIPAMDGGGIIDSFKYRYLEDYMTTYTLEACDKGVFDILWYNVIYNKISDYTVQFPDNGYTILHFLVFYFSIVKDNNRILDIILSSNHLSEFINIQDENGNTPLHLAVKTANDDVADLLIEKGASTKIQNNLGQTVHPVNKKDNDDEDDEEEDELVTLSTMDYDLFGKNNTGNNIISDTSDIVDIKADSIVKQDDTEDFVKEMKDLYSKMNNDTDIGTENSVQRGGEIIEGTRTLAIHQTGSSVFNKNKLVGGKPKVSNELAQIRRALNNQATAIHDTVVSTIQSEFNKSIDEAKLYKAAIYNFVKKTRPELNNYDRAVEMQRMVTDDFLNSVELKNEIEQIQQSRSSVSSEQKYTLSTKDKKSKKSKVTPDSSTDSNSESDSEIKAPKKRGRKPKSTKFEETSTSGSST